MRNPIPLPALSCPLVVGSVGANETLRVTSRESATDSCDIVEIRLDTLVAEGISPTAGLWENFEHLPLLFTARRADEGGSLEWNSEQRSEALGAILPEASCIDIEAASINEMRGVISRIMQQRIPWIASFHDFAGMPHEQQLLEAIAHAKQAGASAFKWAAVTHQPADLARMADFQLEDHGIPVASMGMGKLATVSRLLAAQCGSVLNYGYLGSAATAPGQWHAADLRNAIAQLPAIRT